MCERKPTRQKLGIEMEDLHDVPAGAGQSLYNFIVAGPKMPDLPVSQRLLWVALGDIVSFRRQSPICCACRTTEK